jgi:hypothetical protein
MSRVNKTLAQKREQAAYNRFHITPEPSIKEVQRALAEEPETTVETSRRGGLMNVTRLYAIRALARAGKPLPASWPKAGKKTAKKTTKKGRR